MNRRLTKGIGYDIRETSDTVSLIIDSRKSGDDYPFRVIIKGDKYIVVPGTVNGKKAALGGQYLDEDPPPEGTLTATCEIYLKITHVDGNAFPYLVEVEHDTSLPYDDNDYGYVRLASVTKVGNNYTKTAQYVRTSLYGDRLRCGSSTAEYFFSRA